MPGYLRSRPRRRTQLQHGRHEPLSSFSHVQRNVRSLAPALRKQLLGADQMPWSKRFLDSDIAGKQSEAGAKSKGYDLRKKDTHPSHDIKGYLGDYEKPGYGIVSVAEETGGLLVKLNKLTFPMKHYHYDVFEVPYDPQDPFSKQKLEFFTDIAGDISSLSMPIQPRVKDILFTRMPDKQLTERSFIE